MHHFGVSFDVELARAPVFYRFRGEEVVVRADSFRNEYSACVVWPQVFVAGDSDGAFSRPGDGDGALPRHGEATLVVW